MKNINGGQKKLSGSNGSIRLKDGSGNGASAKTKILLFLDASFHLYKWECPLDHQPVGP